MSQCADVRSAEQPGSGSGAQSLSCDINERQVTADTLRRCMYASDGLLHVGQGPERGHTCNACLVIKAFRTSTDTIQSIRFAKKANITLANRNIVFVMCVFIFNLIKDSINILDS